MPFVNRIREGADTNNNRLSNREMACAFPFICGYSVSVWCLLGIESDNWECVCASVQGRLLL